MPKTASESNPPVISMLGVWRAIMVDVTTHGSAIAAGTYYMTTNTSTANSATTGNSYYVVYIDSANFPTIYGLAPKFRTKVRLFGNDVALGGNITVGLYPVTRPATSGGLNLTAYTIGTVVASSTILFTAPAADSMNVGTSSEFALPANGYYGFGFVSSALSATNSRQMMSFDLEWCNK